MRKAEEIVAEIKERWDDVIKFETLFIEIQEVLESYAAEEYARGAIDQRKKCEAHKEKARKEALEEAASIVENFVPEFGEKIRALAERKP